MTKKIIITALLGAVLVIGIIGWFIPIGIKAEYIGNKLYQSETVNKKEINVEEFSLFGRKSKVSDFVIEPVLLKGVDLEFDKEALEVIVDKAIERKTGARGLRSIIEEIMRDVMYDIPSNKKIAKCIITKETVLENKKPEIIIDENKKPVTLTKQTNKKKIRKRDASETA